mgnify:CR=1 FL=1
MPSHSAGVPKRLASRFADDDNLVDGPNAFVSSTIDDQAGINDNVIE